MFAPPPVIETEVFARLPDNFRLKGQKSTWLEIQRRGVAADSFLEGPSFDRDGNLYVVDIPFGRVFRISPDGGFELIAEYDGEPNGLKIHKDGRIFIADHKNGIMVLDPASGSVMPFYDRPVLERFKGVNDLFFASNGDPRPVRVCAGAHRDDATALSHLAGMGGGRRAATPPHQPGQRRRTGNAAGALRRPRHLARLAGRPIDPAPAGSIPNQSMCENIVRPGVGRSARSTVPVPDSVMNIDRPSGPP